MWGGDVRECQLYLHLHEDAVRESYLGLSTKAIRVGQQIVVFTTALKWEHERPAARPQEKTV